HQMRKGRLVRDHFELLVKHQMAKETDLLPFEAGAFIRNRRIRNQFGVRFRETTHRCRPIMIMAMAGRVADSGGAKEVEVFESGVGAVNLPLRSGPIDFRTTRSTHPHYLRLISELVSRVNEASVSFVLPFAHLTKAELVMRAKELGLADLARRSLS